MNLTNHITNLNHISLWTALVTPMRPDGAIDFDNLIALARLQAKAGNGITLLGSTGEGLALTLDEQLAVVQCVTKLSLNVPIMVAVGGYNLAAQKAWIKQCNQMAIHGYLLTSPIYAKPGTVGLSHWFNELLEQATFPCMIYNVPSRSGVTIPVSTLQNIQHHPNCWALKEASGDLATLLAYRQHCPKIEIYSGEDAMMPYLAAAGVKGLVSVAANIWPQATHRYVELALAGQHHELFPVWQNAVDALFQVASPIATKVLMTMKGQLNHSRLRAPLIEQELDSENRLAEVDQQISRWFNSKQNLAIIENKQVIGVK
ncbi:4-hydroxy-tetrahydrodipicolinate synthase [Thalassotalea insulae]|uniref:4-hydroxy-tetrahydrodipicolinate synthase n=1 Tax=Thalassotalea insulae TaxID=2056778 RepID=A0ABQ6GTG0_9GAMM|nr:4-hydroxy-tetrahydrodipicolinate synthase [Thalassotalea insulae]GLX77942.1 4-hydroxy-tetrahydrodipicolinate synthase [Thalassotalea insulae]